MTTVPHEPVTTGASRWALDFFGPDFWTSMAIMIIWLTVLLDALFGPDIVTDSFIGDHSTVPSAVVLSIPAFFATWVVARYGYRRARS